MDASRKHDIADIEKGLRSSDPLMREVAGNAGKKIKKQLNDSWTRDAREKLVKETLNGNKENAFQIRDDMVKHRGGREGKGSEAYSASFRWAPGQYERIFDE